jgi:hypothetical protein
MHVVVYSFLCVLVGSQHSTRVHHTLTLDLHTAPWPLPRLSLLWAQLEPEYQRFGMYIATNDGSSSSGPQPRRQAGECSTQQ